MTSTFNKAVDQLTVNDTYNLILFALAQLTQDPKYAAISELIYVLDKEHFLKLCEYFGGLEIKIPTVKELEELLYALYIYQQVNLNGKDLDTVLNEVLEKTGKIHYIKSCYLKISDLLAQYKIQ